MVWYRAGLSAVMMCVFWHTFCRSVVADETTATGVSQAELHWPGWRGPATNGHAPESSRPPVEFGPNTNVMWKAAVPGRGHSSPIVVGEQIFLATAEEADQRHIVLGYSLSDGAELWQREVNRGGFPKNNHPKNTEASPTLVCNGTHLYASFFHHQKITLTKLDLAGEIQWQRDVGSFNPQMFEYGYAPSPLLYNDTVIVAAEYDGESYLAALRQSDGTEVWRRPRQITISFSSPVVAEVAGRPQLLLSGGNQLMSYDPATGEELWAVEGTAMATCGTAVWSGDTVFASGGYPQNDTVAVMADGSGRVLWRNTQRCYEQSMIVVDGYVYALTDRGILYCWDAQDGTEQWRERLKGPVSASAVYAGGHIYWANELGTHYVFKPNPAKFEMAAVNQLGDESFASPAVVGDRLLLRVAQQEGGTRQEYLYCVGR